MKEFKGSPHPWHWEGDKLCDANHMIIHGGKFRFKKYDKALVTAAPDLLKELQKLREYVINICDVDEEDCHIEHPLSSSQAAISKALGEE